MVVLPIAIVIIDSVNRQTIEIYSVYYFLDDWRPSNAETWWKYIKPHSTQKQLHRRGQKEGEKQQKRIHENPWKIV